MIYKNIDNTYKKTTIIFISTTIILLISCIILLKINSGYKAGLSAYTDTITNVQSQMSNAQMNTIELTNAYNTATSDLAKANATIESQKKEIEILNQTLSDYKEQVSTLQNSMTSNYSNQQNTSQTNTQQKSSLSVPALDINSTNTQTQETQSVITID